MANFASETIWTGDNLAVMRGMNAECVDLIYLDPPFNSNRTYEAPIGSKAAGAAFKDAWTLDDVDVHEHGELADRNPAAYSIIEAAREAHGKGMQSYLIMMAVRLLEMRRLLKSTGSLYLHCDPTASHYLKLLMDGIFGWHQFRNEIVWAYSGWNKQLRAHLERRHDVVLFYAASKASKFNYPTRPWESTAEYVKTRKQKVRVDDERREYVLSDAGGGKRVKRYLDDAMQYGVPLDDVWRIDKLNNSDRVERTGYPTQKPLALLERIIHASSNAGDLILDPFCGCATTLVAARRLGRQWAGIDLSPLAIKLVNERIAADLPLWGGATALDVPPVRTDLGILPNYRTHRHRLYGEQEGVCVGCETHFPFRVMDVDHILPRSRVARTTLTTCNCSALAATAVRGGARWPNGERPYDEEGLRAARRSTCCRDRPTVLPTEQGRVGGGRENQGSLVQAGDTGVASARADSTGAAQTKFTYTATMTSEGTQMPKKQTSSRVSTLASQVLSGEKKPTLKDAKTLAASVLSQDEKKGQQPRRK